MSLFRAIVKALVKNVGNFASGELLGAPIAGDILVDTWDYWAKGSADEAKRKAEIEGIARQAVKDALTEAQEAVRLEASQLPQAQQQVIVVYLCQVPATIQRSLRRPEDPTGTTFRRGQALRNANDLAQFLPPTLPCFRPGDELPGRPGWVLDRQLGGGGFGEVWVAQQPHLGFARAVKFCKSLQNADRDLRHECKLIIRIVHDGKHPNVVPLLDAYLEGDAPWLMYEYVEGGDLGDMIRFWWDRLPPSDRQKNALLALQILAKAVGRFHRLKTPIVHRDLKPANILYDKKAKKLRITDFGIGGIAAREMLDGEKRGTLTNGQSWLYGSYTPLYASPQQKAGAAPDPRDDVHALGVIGYQMMTGQMSQGVGPDYANDLDEHGVGEALIKLLGRCTAQKAERRPRDAANLADLLEHCIEQHRTKSIAPMLAALDRQQHVEQQLLQQSGETPVPAKVAEEKKRLTVAEMLAAARAERSRGAKRAGDVHPANPAAAAVAVRRPSVAEMMAMARAEEPRGVKRAGDVQLANPEKPPAAAVAGGRPSVAEMMAMARAERAKAAGGGPTEKSAGDLRSDNTLGMKLVWCPAVRFMMGSPASETERNDDEEQVEVTLTKGFWLAQTSVTQAQFKLVMGSEPWSGKDYVKEGLNYPATYVDWNDATEFCKKLTESESRSGRLPQGWKYDLPTEAQREYATRAGTTTAYSFGDAESKLSDYGWWGGIFGDGNAKMEQYAHQVGTKKPNAWGLYDVHGNVYEWCRDYYADKLPGGVDPFVGTGTDRVIRGGSWPGRAVYCRSAFRSDGAPDDRHNNVGFRFLLVPSSSGQ